MKDRMQKEVTGIKAFDRSVGLRNLMLDDLAFPVTATLLCSQRKALATCLEDSPDSTLHRVYPLLLGNLSSSYLSFIFALEISWVGLVFHIT